MEKRLEGLPDDEAIRAEIKGWQEAKASQPQVRLLHDGEELTPDEIIENLEGRTELGMKLLQEARDAEKALLEII